MNNRSLIAATACLLMPGLPVSLHAEEERENYFAIGVGGGYHQSIMKGLDDVTQALPLLEFEYNGFFMGGAGLSYRFLEGEAYELYVGLGADLFEADRKDSKDLKDMGNVSSAIYAEVGGDVFTPIGLLGFNVYSDISNKHDGYGAGVEWALPLPPIGNFQMMPSLTVEWMSEEIINHHYGVSAAHAKLGRPQYTGEAGMVYGVSLMGQYQINKNWGLMVGGGVNYYSDEITDSPIVDEDSSAQGFIGIQYMFD